MWRTVHLFGPPIAYCAVIFFFSAQSTLPATPGGDKLAHVLAYAVMGALFARAFWFFRPWPAMRVAFVSFFVSALYGASDEWHQSFVPGRFPSVGDAVADAVGAAIGAVVVVLLLRRFFVRACFRTETERMGPE